MAAAEYFNPSIPPQQGPPPSNQNLRPPSQAPAVQNPSSPSSLPYPLSDAPPPYSAFAEQQRPQSQPPPQQRPPQPGYTNGGYQPYHPPQPQQQNGDTHQYPPEKVPQRPNLQNTYRPSDYTTQYPPPPPAPQQQQHAPPQPQQQNGFTRPGLSSLNYPGKEVRFTNPRPSSQPAPTGYSPHRYRSPSRSRSRSRSRERRSRRHHSHRPAEYSTSKAPDKKKGSSASTFLGAGGGALLGDMIFPGLGTLGGAILGGVGGHEYSKDKKSRHGSAGPGQRSYSHGDGAREREYYYEDDHKRGRR